MTLKKAKEAAKKIARAFDITAYVVKIADDPHEYDACSAADYERDWDCGQFYGDPIHEYNG